MSGKPKRCPFCGATPHQGEGKVRHCQLHGEPFQDFYVWCPHLCARKSGGNKALAIEEWNKRPIEDEALTALRTAEANIRIHCNGSPEIINELWRVRDVIAKMEGQS